MPLLFNFVLEYAIMRVQVNHDGLKLIGLYQLLVYAGDVNVLGGSVHNIKWNTGAILLNGKEIGLEVNADKTKYMVMSGDENVGRSYDTNILWKSRRVQIFENNLNGSKFHSVRN